MSAEQGKLTLVGVPIGNLQDLSPRGKQALAEADLVACEDTRVTARLLQAVGLEGKPLLSYHAHNLRSREGQLVERLESGQKLALVSDAGMPCISDPGTDLVTVCHEQGLEVRVVPGPTAFVTALAASGLDSRRFVFEGFLEAKGSERNRRLQELAREERTILLYEAPHRLVRTLEDLLELGLGRRRLCLAREISKRYEEFLILEIEEALRHYEHQVPRGEFVLVLEGAEAFAQRLPELAQAQSNRTPQDLSKYEQALRAGESVKNLARAYQTEFACKRNEAYQILQEMKEKLEEAEDEAE